jgi:hypothetical protein
MHTQRLTCEGKEQEMNNCQHTERSCFEYRVFKWSCECNKGGNRLVAFGVSRIAVQEEVKRIERLTLRECLQEQHTIYFSFVWGLSHNRIVLDYHFHASHDEY